MIKRKQVTKYAIALILPICSSSGVRIKGIQGYSTGVTVKCSGRVK